MAVKNSMETKLAIEQAIRDRLETGFKNWNGGYEGWLNWCETLYEPDAYYNIPFKGSQCRFLKHIKFKFPVFFQWSRDRGT